MVEGSEAEVTLDIVAEVVISLAEVLAGEDAEELSSGADEVVDWTSLSLFVGVDEAASRLVEGVSCRGACFATPANTTLKHRQRQTSAQSCDHRAIIMCEVTLGRVFDELFD